MKLIALFLFIMNFSFAQEDTCHVQKCRSQLMRLEVDSKTLARAVESSPELQSGSVEALRTYFNSDLFSDSFETGYAIPSIAFPHNQELCLAKKADGNTYYQNIECVQENFCSNETIPEDIRSEMCFSFPCAFFKGDINQCPHTPSNGRPTRISFPKDIQLRDIDLEPLDVTLTNGEVSGCFNVTKLDVDIDVQVEMANDPQVNYQPIGMQGIELRVNQTRRVCMSASIDLQSSTPISNVKIKRADQKFVSGEMVSRAVENAKLIGLDSYSEGSRRVVRTSILKPMTRHFQKSIENSIELSLASAFEERLSGYFNQFTGSSTRQIETPKSSFISELGVSNMMVSKYADLLECSILKSRGETFADHKCLTKSYNFGSDPLKSKQVPKLDKAVRYLKEQFTKYGNITSEALRLKLKSFESKINSKVYKRDIEPLVTEIGQNQERSRFMDGIELFTNLQTQQNNQSLGVGLQGICNTENNSPHKGRAINGCPVQVYVDTNEFNRLLTAMYEDGRMCHRGRGDFIPERDSNGQQVYRNRFAQGQGCEFEMEEKKGGLKCYLNGAPQLNYDPRTGKYVFDMKTKHCYRGSVFAGQGRIGGDINFEISYNPSICENGDLCLKDGSAEWNVVPGTERYALRDGSLFSGIVKDTINDQLTAMMSESVKLSFSDGVLAGLPIKAGSQVDKGEGFFGLCLELKR